MSVCREKVVRQSLNSKAMILPILLLLLPVNLFGTAYKNTHTHMQTERKRNSHDF